MKLRKEQDSTQSYVNQRRLILNSNASFHIQEAYRSLQTNIRFSLPGNGCKVICLTSSMASEGKSTTCLNLAISMAETGNRVLLIDADMRKPSLHRYLRTKKDPLMGLSALLSGEMKVGDCLQNTEYGFDLIPGGPVPPNPVELISSEAMRALLHEAAEHYDYIICDAPPVGVITDAAALSPLCDGVLYVIRQKYANKHQVHGAIQSLQTVNAKILGTVLNQYDISKDAVKGYGYSRGYGYGVE